LSVRAFVVTAPGKGSVVDVQEPEAGPGEVVVEVERVGLCGTDVELFSGEMAYVEQGVMTFPMRLGHEWSGRVREAGSDVDPRWVGRRVTGDTMIGDGTCRRCLRGQQHVCESRHEVGVRDGRAGALAERLVVPVSSLHRLPGEVDATLGALVEPGGNALRAARATEVGTGDRVLVMGPGTIGSLVALFLRPTGAEVHVMGRSEEDLAFVRTLGFDACWTEQSLPVLPFDAVVDASNAAHLPGFALDVVEPGGRVVYIGLAGSPSVLDTRTLALKDVTAVGVLSASPGLADTIAAYADGTVDPRPLVGATLALGEAADVLSGRRCASAGEGPKFHIDPRL
jgi:threonine dehydrogenase-like Zn-dependent dehydrogenase